MRAAMLFRFGQVLILAGHAWAWGDMGHRAIGYLSQQYMTPEAVQLFNDVVEPSNSFDISDAAVWADRHRIGAWAYTYNWHFIDARDDPPTQCNVKYKRDCEFRGECDEHKSPGCVVGQIVNQTNIILSNVEHKEKQNAMKFLLHFVGDVHQPLHVEDLAVGGNQICVKWKGRAHNTEEYYAEHASDEHGDRIHSSPTKSWWLNPFRDDDDGGTCPPWIKCKNLHAIWDSAMIEEMLDYTPPRRKDDPTEQQEKAAALQWANDLASDSDGNPPLEDGDCVPVGPASRAQACAQKWAGESNALVCSYVLRDGRDAVEHQELSGDYYQGAVPIIKSQITRAARRFAATLNAVAGVAAAERLTVQDL